MKPFRQILSRVVITHPKSILILFLVAVSGALFLLPGLKTDPNPWLLKETHEARKNLEVLRQNFTSSRDSIYILLEAQDTIFNPTTLSRIQSLTEKFENINLSTHEDKKKLLEFSKTLNEKRKKQVTTLLYEGLGQDSWDDLENLMEGIKKDGNWTPNAEVLFKDIITKISPVIKVTSLANTDNITGNAEGLKVRPVYEDPVKSESDITQISESVLGNELFQDILITKDKKYTSIIVELSIADSDTINQYLMLDEVKDILNNQVPGSEKHFISGLPAMAATLGHIIQVDTERLFPIVLALVVICLFVSFRMVMGILTPILVVTLSLIITLALKAAFQIPINVITTSIPVFILSIGVADGIHLFSEFRDHILSGMSKTESVQRTMNELTVPIIMTSLTTAAAFWTLSVTEIVQLQHFGWFIAMGTIIAMLFSLLFIPALLYVLPEPKRVTEKKSSVIDRSVLFVLNSMSGWTIRNPLITLLSALIVTLISAYGATKVFVDNDNIKYFKSNLPIVKSTIKINEVAAGTTVLNILIDDKSGTDEPFQIAENLKTVANLIEYIEKKPEVGKIMGFTKLIERINFVMNEENPFYHRIPNPVEIVENSDKVSGSDLISQYILLYESGGGDYLSDFVNTEYNRINIPVILRTNSARTIKIIVDDITKKAQKLLPKSFSVKFSGTANIAVEATSEIVKGQLVSLGMSFLLVFFLLMLTFRSILTGLIAMLPLVTTILVNFGIMGFFKIPLDVGTAVISSIVIGIGVDYSIHYLKRFQENRRAGENFENAIMKTVKHSGRAIMLNAFTVGAGFIAMLFSILTPLITMGWMITVTMFVSSLTTLVFLPAILKITSKEALKPSDEVHDLNIHIDDNPLSVSTNG